MAAKVKKAGIELLEEYLNRCRVFMNNWINFNQLLMAYKNPAVNKPQVETAFLQLKSKIARDHQVLRDRLGTDCGFSRDITNIMAGATNLEAIHSQSEVSVKKLQNEWHRAFITINETFGMLEDKRARVLQGEKVFVAGYLIQLKIRKPIPWRMIAKRAAITMAVLLVVGTLYFMRAYLGFWAPQAGEGLPIAASMSDEDRIRVMLSAFEQALEAHDVDRLMTTISDNFADEEGRGKTELRVFVQGAVTTGALKGVNVDYDFLKIAVNGKAASVGPIALQTAEDGVSFQLTCAREGQAWLITSGFGY